jgi:hypothetical protein
MPKSFRTACALAAGLCLLSTRAFAEGPLALYTTHLVNGFQNWSWAPNNFTNSFGGSNCISVNAADWQAIALQQNPFNTTYYTNVSFWINGGAGGGQVVQVIGTITNGAALSYALPALPKNTWMQYTIPLSTLGLGNVSNCTGLWFQLTASGTTNMFYVTGIQMAAARSPSLVHIGLNATNAIRTADSRWFGVNTAIWDSYFDTPTTLSALQQAGLGFLRFPGGSLSDDYHWARNTTDSNTFTWATSFTLFAQIATNLGASVIITANYGTGSPSEAAGWVRNSNITNHYGFKYWEIGNEVYGTWETDSNARPHDPYTYATNAANYISAMKVADPTIKIGVVVVTGEDANSNGYSAHPATNLVTHQVHYGWTPVVLATLKSLGVTPDFLIYHWYPEYTGTESDPLLLQGTSNWIGDSASIRLMVTDYVGASGTNIELLVTENNSNSGSQGQQSVSLVNALYYADSFCQLMTTEFNSYVWWDLRNGTDKTGTIDPTLYGWRLYGDIGMLDGLATSLTDRYPHYFTARMMQYFLRGGDTVLKAFSDWGLLSAYAVHRTNGSLTLMVINKDSTSNLTANIALSNFAPNSAATIYSYGMPQDNAAETGIGSCDVAQTNYTSATTNFSYTFAPYSVTVFAFAPAQPMLTVLPGQSAVQINGQPNVPYVWQVSSDLMNWTSLSTNQSVAGTVVLTNSIGPGAQFWRAVWKP